MSLGKKVAKNTVLDIAGRVIQLVISSITIIILTRYLGPKGYGLYALILAFVGMFSDISGLGINMTIARKIPNQKDKESKIFSTALSLKILTSALIFGLAIIGGLFFYQESQIRIGIILAAISSFFLSITVVYKAIYQIKLRIKNYVFADIISRTVGFILVLAFVYILKLDLNYILLTLVISSLINWLITDYYVRKLTSFSWQIDLSAWKNLIIEALPIAGFVIVSGISQKIGIVILSKYAQPEAVGIYQLALQPIIIVTGMAALFISFVYPQLSKYLKENRKKLISIFTKTISFLFNLGLYLSLFFFLTGSQIISIIGGSKYYQAIPIITVLAIGMFFRFISYGFRNMATAQHKEKTIFYIQLVSLILTVAISLLGVSEYGILAIAWAFTIGEIVSALGLIVLEAKNIAEGQLITKTIKQLPSVVILSVLLYFLSNSFWLKIEQFEEYNIVLRILVLGLIFAAYLAPLIYNYKNLILKTGKQNG